MICLRSNQSLGKGTCATSGTAAITGRQYQQGALASIIVAGISNPHSTDRGKVNILFHKNRPFHLLTEP